MIDKSTHFKQVCQLLLSLIVAFKFYRSFAAIACGHFYDHKKQLDIVVTRWNTSFIVGKWSNF